MRREEFYRKLPYVTELRGEHDTPCDGIKYSKVAMRDLYPMYGKPARGIQPRARCKNRARWRFTATRRLRRGNWETPATSGNYCTLHLSMELDHPAEARRAEKWFNKLYPNDLDGRT